jgi:CHAT domain-containing protein
VDSLYLVQGALSLWSYAGDIPYAPGTPGYFNRIVKHGLVRGPLITTLSARDTAVGRIYPLGAQLQKQFVLGEEYPKYGGIGTFGIRGIGGIEDMAMQPATFAYNFRGGRVYNLEASGVIKNGTGASGAHSDIAHREVAHAFWAAVLAGLAMPSGPADELPTRGLPPFGGGVLSAGPPPPPTWLEPDGVKPPYPGPSSDTATRWINAELEDHAPDEPLATGHWYTLAFDVDLAQRATSIGSVVLADEKLFPESSDEVVLTVQLVSADFEISDCTRPLRLSRAGKSRTKARFDISPQHDGRSILKATFHKDGNFIQQMELAFDVGATRATPVEITARGRPPSAASVVHPRDVGLSMSPIAGGYDCVVWGGVSARARLPLSPAFLASAIDTVRLELMKVVMHLDAAGKYVFQSGIDIPDADRDFALKTMARAGALLFQKIFFGPAAGADSKAVGEFLRKMASDRTRRLKLQIVAESTPLPWGLLYVGDASSGAELDWDNFIGMRHLIEQIPLQNTITVSDNIIPSDKPRLTVSVNVNSGIDAQMGADFVAQQQSFWEGATASRKRVRVVARTMGAEVVRALADGSTEDQILYFYCHAESTDLTDAGGPDSSSLVFSDARLTLGDLNLDAPTTTQLHGNPLVFINACESAEMSPVFYDGFVPYFMAKGARGVVGTECKTPALFAVAWANRFFERFLDGETLGEAFLGLRQEFREKHGNPLGLLYAVHCDGDTLIQPALAATA